MIHSGISTPRSFEAYKPKRDVICTWSRRFSCHDSFLFNWPTRFSRCDLSCSSTRCSDRKAFRSARKTSISLRMPPGEPPLLHPSSLALEGARTCAFGFCLIPCRFFPFLQPVVHPQPAQLGTLPLQRWPGLAQQLRQSCRSNTGKTDVRVGQWSKKWRKNGCRSENLPVQNTEIQHLVAPARNFKMLPVELLGCYTARKDTILRGSTNEDPAWLPRKGSVLFGR